VIVLGVAYKRDIDDMRESPALHIIERLFAKGADVCYHDPFVPSADTAAGTFQSIAFNPETIQAADAVVIVTDHTDVEYELLAQHAQLIIDTRNAMKGREDSRIVRL
jgi:UDP-N-acetyl-D-glucosamine dehydrogenase